MDAEQQKTPVGEPADSTPPAKALIGLLSEQCRLYRQLASLAEIQRGLIARNDTGRLLEVLSERQRLIDELQELASRTRPYQADWPGVRRRLEPEDVCRVDELVAEVNGSLKRIIDQDAADADLLAARKSATGQAMATVQAGRQAGAAYAAAAAERQSCVDWTDE